MSGGLRYSVRFYRSGEFCMLVQGIYDESSAIEHACDNIHGDGYDSAEIYKRSAALVGPRTYAKIGTVNNDGVFKRDC